MIIKEISAELAKEAAKLCRQSMRNDIMPDFLFREKVFDDIDYMPELNLAAIDEADGTMAGIISSVIRKSHQNKTGFVKLLCVADSYRRQGIASSLYLQIEEIFKREGVAEIRVYDSVPNYFMPGIDPFYTEAVCFFERKGFVKFNDTCNLLADLLNDTFDTGLDEERLLKDGILVKRACEEDKTMLMDFINKYFEGWAGEVTSSFNNSPKTIFIAVQNDEVIAFSAHEGNNKGTGWFGPMGTNPGIRKKGVGGVLLKKCLKDLKEMGFVKAIIPWVGPIPFYMHYANAKVNRIFWRYKKIIN